MKSLARILALIRKTGDRYIFEDKEGNFFVLLPIDDYENIIFKNNSVKSLSEEELLNKINKDIAIWKASQDEENISESLAELDEKKSEMEDQYYFEPVEDEE